MKIAHLKLVLWILAVTLAWMGDKSWGTEVTGSEETERYVSEFRQGIENYYAIELAEVEARCAEQIRLLEVADNFKYIQSGFGGWSDYVEAVAAADCGKREFEELFDEIRGTGLRQRDFRFPELVKFNARRLAAVEIIIAEKKNEIVSSCELEALELEQAKEHALQRALRRAESEAAETAEAVTVTEPEGMVTGIVYSEDKPLAIIAGRVVKEGDEIDGVLVVRIEANQIEFKKAGKKWVQQVRSKPGSAW